MAGPSVGGAAAAGLESGLGIGLRMRAQENAEEQQRRANLIQDEQLQRQREADQRLEDDRALDAVNKSFDDLRAEGEGYVQQYGKAIPDEIAGPYKQRVGEVSTTRNALLRKRYAPIVQQREQRAKDIAMQLQSGKVDLKDLSPADLYDAIHVQTRRDPADLIGKDGKPSKVSAAVTDIVDGLQYGNEGAVLRGANVLFEPELKVGVGELSPHGGTIVGKQIVKLIPNPNDPGKFMPVLKVFVRRGAQSTGDTARADHVAEEGAPPGATGYYLAPMTKNRSSDPEDPPESIDIQRAMDYAGQMQTLSTALAHPEIASKLESAAKSRGNDDFLTAFYAVRGKMPAKAVEYKAVKPGERLVGINPQTGAPTGQVIEGAPRTEKKVGLSAQIQAVQDYAEEQGISEAEAAIQLQQQGLLRAPKGAKGAGSGGGGGGLEVPKGITGPDVLKNLSEDDATIVQGLADGSVKPSEISQKGNRREKLLALAKRFDPTADFGPSGKLKDVPAPAQKALLENNTNLNRVDRALRLIGAMPPQPGEEGDVDKEATGLKGFLPASILNRTDPKGVAARAAIADLGSLVIHDRSGAAVSASEFPRLQPFIPSANDDAATVEKKLKRFREVYAQEMEALEATYGPDNGYKAFKVGGDSGAGKAAARPANTPQRQSGDVTPAPAAPKTPPRNAKGWVLMTDAKGNRAYVSPDGKSFEEVR